MKRASNDKKNLLAHRNSDKATILNLKIVSFKEEVNAYLQAVCQPTLKPIFCASR